MFGGIPRRGESPPVDADRLFVFVARNYFKLPRISSCLGKKRQDTASDVDRNDLR
jgi:hypothetical protein